MAGTWTWQSTDTLSCPDNYPCPTFKANSTRAPQVVCEASWWGGSSGGCQSQEDQTAPEQSCRSLLRGRGEGGGGGSGGDWNRSWDVGHINKAFFFFFFFSWNTLPSPHIYIILYHAHHHFYQPQGLWSHVMMHVAAGPASNSHQNTKYWQYNSKHHIYCR